MNLTVVCAHRRWHVVYESPACVSCGAIWNLDIEGYFEVWKCLDNGNSIFDGYYDVPGKNLKSS